MIRLIIGIFLMMGSVGAIEQDTMSFGAALFIAILGGLIAGSALPKLNEQYK